MFLSLLMKTIFQNCEDLKNFENFADLFEVIL